MYRFYITIGITTTEVTPLGFNSTSLVDQKERDQIFYRTKFQGNLVFTAADYALLWTQEQADPCVRIELLIQRRDAAAATYHTYWEGFFTTNDGEFDLDKCTFTITPAPDDVYEVFMSNSNREFNILDVPTEIILNMDIINFLRNRDFVDVIEFIADSIVTGVGVNSNFFTAATNPVTLKPNKYRNMTIAAKSDIKRPTASNPATTALLSFGELMEILRLMFNVYWDYDGTNLRIEHISYFTSVAGMDLRTQPLTQGTNRYKYLKEEMPKFEKFNFMESESIDFIGLPIYYESLCVNSDPDNNVFERSVRVSTDIETLYFNTEGISDDGFVILTTYQCGADRFVAFGQGLLSTEIRFNMALSWAHLHHNFFRHDRVLPQGYLNDNLTTFFSSRKNKNQELTAIICQGDDFDPQDYMLTSLGDIFSEDAYVLRAERRPSGQTTLSLVYGAEKLPPAAISTDVIMWLKWVRTVGSEITATLSEARSEDVVFWVHVDDGIDTECIEMFIPAGGLCVTEAMVFQPITIMFNFSDASMTGIIPYADGDTIVETALCTPVAPAVVEVTGVDAIVDGVEFTEIDVNIDYNNTGGAGTYQVDWEIYDISDVLIDDGSVNASFAAGIGNRNIGGIMYPAADFDEYYLRIKSVSDGAWQTSNNFYSLFFI